MSVSQLANKIIDILDENKAEEIKVYKNQSIADYMIVASAESARHSKALADTVTKIIKGDKVKYHIEGYTQANWILVDTFDIMVHIFRPDVRKYYQVDALWT